MIKLHRFSSHLAKATLVLSILAPISQAHALLFDFNTFFFDRVLGQTSDTQSTTLTGDAAIAMSLDQDGMYSLGFGALYAGTTDKAADGSKTTWSSFDYGIRFIAHFNRTKEWGMSFAYHPMANGVYEGGGTKEYWEGSSVHLSIGYTPLIFHGCYMGFRLNYYKAMYDQMSVDKSTFVSESNSQDFVYPSIFISFRN